ncbi:hypothetical protein ABER75_26155 [Niallia taxi]|uniref:hypothetical protein n=1 Tax=Niallia taxi TaxID=2499688 RepID=UPI003D296894
MFRKEDEDMQAEAVLSKKRLKKPSITKNKFANMTSNDWKEANEISKSTRDISGLTYRDVYGGK